MSTIITAAELASELGTDGRTARKFLRSITPRDEQPGKGRRWGIDGGKRNIAKMRKQFAEFAAAQEAARAEREAAAEAAAAPAEEIDDTIDFDSLEGPTDEELAELDA